MSYPKKILRLRPTKGIVTDVPPNEVAPEFYTAGRNVLMRRGFASRVLGSRQVYATLPANVLHLRYALGYWLAFGAATIRALKTSAVSDVSMAGQHAIAEPWQWASALLNGIPIATNGADPLSYWAGNVGAPFVTLPDWNANWTCASVAVFKFHIFALDLTLTSARFQSLIKWSDAAEPGTVPGSWTPADDNEAGDVELSDAPGPVMCAAPGRGSLIIYKPTATYAADYVAGESIFAFRQLFSTTGALTRHAVASMSGQQLVVTGDDIIITDGQNRQSIGQQRMRTYLFNQLGAGFANLFTFYNRPQNEVLICYPVGTDTICSQALVYDVSNDSFGVRDLPQITCAELGVLDDALPLDTWDADAQAWDADNTPWDVTGSPATEALVFGSGAMLLAQDTADLVTLDASIGRYDLTFGDPERVKFVRRVHVRAEPGFEELLVRVGSRMSPSESIAWSNEVALQEPAQIVNTFAQGRYISAEVRSNRDKVWTVTGIDLEGEVRGYH